MYSLSNIFFWVSLAGIFASIFIAFYIPGRVVIGNQKIVQKRMVHVISIILGIVLWAWQGYVFGLFNLRWLSYLYLGIFIFFYLFKKYYRDLRFSFHFLKKADFISLIIIISGILAQTMSYFQIGLETGKGIILNNNLYDHIWHAGLIRELIDRFPPDEPGMAGIILKDYHYFFNLVTADVIRVFHLPPLHTQFIGMYLLASILLGFMGYYFAKLIYDKKIFIRLFLFLLFFSGDVTGWTLLIFQHRFDFALSSLINNGAKFVDSPAFAYSLLIGFAGFYLIFQEKGKLSKRLIFICALLFGSLFEFKIYTAMTFMAGLFAFTAISVFKKRYDRIALFILSCIFGAIIFFPNTSASGGLFFLPFEVPRDFITQKSLGLQDWVLRWNIYQEHANYLRIFQYGIYMSVVYLVVQYGLQLIGLIPLKKTFRILTFERAAAFYSIVITGMVLGLFFYQKVGGANIWEFFLPAGVILSLLTALTITHLIEDKNRSVKITLIILIVIIVIPRWILTVKEGFINEYLSGFHGISKEEYLSYDYIEHFVPKNDIILVVNPIRPVAYVSVVKVFSGARLYFSGAGVRQKDTPEIIKRSAVLKEAQGRWEKYELDILSKEHVKYLYYYDKPPKAVIKNKGLKIEFKNKMSTIFRILP